MNENHIQLDIKTTYQPYRQIHHGAPHAACTYIPTLWYFGELLANPMPIDFSAELFILFACLLHCTVQANSYFKWITQYTINQCQWCVFHKQYESCYYHRLLIHPHLHSGLGWKYFWCISCQLTFLRIHATITHSCVNTAERGTDLELYH